MKAFADFVKVVDSEGLKVEGLCVLQGGKTAFEHRWTPDRDRNIYSHTKSFVSTAVGIALDEGLLTLDDRLVDAFPDKVPADGNPGIELIRLRHLLTMSSGFGKALLMMDNRRSGVGFPDYLTYMLSQPVVAVPGTRFCYSTADSILLGRMLERRTGKHLLEFMYERLLRPMGIPCPIWECCPQGHPIGGGGMFLHLTDMARLGQLYLDEGMWEGKRIVSAEWVRTATAFQIETRNPVSKEDLSAHPGNPWNMGYGYQFWRSPYPSSYRADGAFGQITTVLPEKGFVVGIQCPENGDFGPVQAALHEMIERL
jgi:CubicO group peptidase (beta-lactamase class C family)